MSTSEQGIPYRSWQTQANLDPLCWLTSTPSGISFWDGKSSFASHARLIIKSWTRSGGGAAALHSRRNAHMWFSREDSLDRQGFAADAGPQSLWPGIPHCIR